MTLSRMENRGTLRGVVQKSAPQDYENLINLPTVNNETVIGNKSGHDYHLANLSDIPSVPGVMQGATASSDGTAGQAPQPHAGDQDKFLAGDGFWKKIITGVDYSTQEQDTGLKWIDGKKIYRTVLQFNNLYNDMHITIPQHAYTQIIKLQGIANYYVNGDIVASVNVPYFHNTSNYIRVYFQYDNDEYYLLVETTSTQSEYYNKGFIIFEYTKD